MSDSLVTSGLGWPESPSPSASRGLGWPTAAKSADDTDISGESGIPVSRWEDVVATEHAPPGSRRPEEVSARPVVSRETSPTGYVTAASIAAAHGGADNGLDTPLAHATERRLSGLASMAQRRLTRPPSTRVFGVANQKGGVGKTTTAVNIAAALVRHGFRVLVVDIDPQGNASTALSVEHGEGIPGTYDVLIEGIPMRDVLAECAELPGLFVVPATIDLAGAEIELVSMVERETMLRDALDAYLAESQRDGDPYDYVFIDCPPSLGLLTVNALTASRELLIPLQCEYYALEGLAALLRTIEQIRDHLNPELHVGAILLTMYDARTRLAAGVAAEVRRHFGDLVLHTAVPRSVRISEAPSYGQTVITYDPGSAGSLSYLEAASELARQVDGIA